MKKSRNTIASVLAVVVILATCYGTAFALGSTPVTIVNPSSSPVPVSISPSAITAPITHQGTETDYYNIMDASHCSQIRITVNSFTGSYPLYINVYNLDLPGYGIALVNDQMTSQDSYIYSKVIDTPGASIQVEILNYNSYQYRIVVNCKP